MFFLFFYTTEESWDGLNSGDIVGRSMHLRSLDMRYFVRLLKVTCSPNPNPMTLHVAVQ